MVTFTLLSFDWAAIVADLDGYTTPDSLLKVCGLD